MDAQVMERGRAESSSSTEEERYQALKRECHDAFIYVDQALTSDERGDMAKAVELYHRARHHLEKGFGIQCSREEATKLRSKMTRSLAHVQARLQYLEPMMAPQQNGDAGTVQPTAPPREIEPPAPPTTTRPVAPPPPPSSVPQGACATPTQADNDLPPAYSEVVPQGHITAGSTADERDFISLGDSIMYEEEASRSSVFIDADELLCIPDGVQIFYVSPDGHVSAPSYPGPLRIVKIPDQNTTFLQVSDWLYPLVPGQSPSLHSNNGAYMFPDVLSGQYGSCVGVVISSEVDAVQQTQFQSLLQEYSQLHTQPPEAQEGVGEAGIGDLTQVVGTVPTAPPAEAPRRPEVAPRRPEVAPRRPEVAPRRPEVAPRRPEVAPQRPTVAPERPEEPTTKEVPQWSQKVSKGLVVGAGWVSWGATKGAELTGKLVTKGTAKLKERIRPDEKPAQVDPKYVKGAQVARATTDVTLKVTMAVVVAVRDLTLRVGRELAPHVKRVGTQLLPDSVKDDTDGKKKQTMDGVVEVAAGGLQAFSTVYLALEAAAVSIAKNIGNATVETVEHKYGTQAGRVANDAVNTVGNAGLAWHYMDDIGIKAILKRTAKDAGKAAIEDYRRDKGAGGGDPSSWGKGGSDGAGGPGAAGGAAGGAMGNML